MSDVVERTNATDLEYYVVKQTNSSRKSMSNQSINLFLDASSQPLLAGHHRAAEHDCGHQFGAKCEDASRPSRLHTCGRNVAVFGC